MTDTIAVKLTVAPNGDDTNPGNSEKPFATLHRAQQAVRQHQDLGKKPITVIVKAGTYYLDNPLVFTNADSGSKNAPVTYTAQRDENVVLSGGMKLSLKWKSYREGILQAQTPPGLEIDQFFVNGKRRHMARYPNYDVDARPYNGAAADAFSPSRAAGWADPTGGYIHAMHAAHWGGYHYRITGKKDNNEVTYEGGWQNNRQMGMHKNHRFVENIFEELDAPDEWFHDAKNNTLYYMPDTNVDIKTALFEVARLRYLVEFQGTLQTPVTHISLEGFTFCHAVRTFMLTKEPLLRSDWTIYRGGAVFLTGAEDCTISDCRFDQLGGNSIFVSNYNRRITVASCHIHGSGASGICFVGDPESVRNPLFEYHQRQAYADIDKAPGPKTDNYPADCLVEDCLIHNVSVVEKQATGVQISMSKGITVRHCSIYDVGRAGINISEGTFGGHVIEFCDVFDTVRETGDHGSFNSWGRDRFWGLKDAPQNELAELALLDTQQTIIRNSRWRCDHWWDIDLDDGSSNYHVYNNLCLNGGIKLREGFHRICENNIMVNNSFHPHVWYKNSRDIFRRNIIFIPYKPIRVPTPWGSQCDYNLLHNSTLPEPVPAAKLQQQSTLDHHSIIANAMFVDPAKCDYRVKEGSPALKQGFKNFPMDSFGVQKPELKAIARTPSFPTIRESRLKTTADTLSYWQGATVKMLSGQEYSAFGVSKEEAGIHLKLVPADSFAARARLKTNDLIQAINDQSVKTMIGLLMATDLAKGQPLKIKYVRAQKTGTLIMTSYVYVATETTDTRLENLRLLPGNEVLKFKRITTNHRTSNQPLNVLSDGKLAKNYGPVFSNGMLDGRYEIDLGKDVAISQINTWSFNQNGNRGPQRFTLFGAGEKTKQIPIAVVDTTKGLDGNITASRVQASDGKPLGEFNRIEWAVKPVTNLQENTAFQEFQVR